MIDEVPVNVLKAIVKDGGKSDLAMLKPKGLKFVIFSDHSFIYLLYNYTRYWINVDIDNSDIRTSCCL